MTPELDIITTRSMRDPRRAAPVATVGPRKRALVVVTAVTMAVMSGCSSSGGGSGASTDPIEQARVVLSANYGESHSYDSIKSVTDTALSNMGEVVDDDRRGRAWSAVLAVLEEPKLADVSPMDVMRCVATDDGGAAESAGMRLSDMVALCAVTLG